MRTMCCVTARVTHTMAHLFHKCYLPAHRHRINYEGEKGENSWATDYDAPRVERRRGLREDSIEELKPVATMPVQLEIEEDENEAA